MRVREGGEVREMVEADSPNLFFFNPGLGDWKKRKHIKARKEGK